MTSIDKTIFPHGLAEEKKFDWGERYTTITPIFNVCISPDLSELEYTIELLGSNNFKKNLEKLYNILLNKEENHRLENFSETILNRELLLKKIVSFSNETSHKPALWDSEWESEEETFLEILESDLGRKLVFERKIY